MLEGMKPASVYIMANGRNGTIYIGVTTDLPGRVWQHKIVAVPGFTRSHACKMLVWFEMHDDLEQARQREVQMKRWKRQWKLSTIETMNPQWNDLYPLIG